MGGGGGDHVAAYEVMAFRVKVGISEIPDLLLAVSISLHSR